MIFSITKVWSSSSSSWSYDKIKLKVHCSLFSPAATSAQPSPSSAAAALIFRIYLRCPQQYTVITYIVQLIIILLPHDLPKRKMTSALDMSLDDLIKNNKKPLRGGRGGTSSGPQRRAPDRSANRATPYTVAKPLQQAPETTWQHDMYDEKIRDAAPSARAEGIETGTKLYISNLDYGVSNEDIKELFSEVGDLKRSAIHYDRSGRSKGTAEVVFARRADAVAAIKRYNNVQLDGKPIRIDIIGTNLVIPAKNPQSMNGMPESATGPSGRMCSSVCSLTPHPERINLADECDSVH